MDKPKFNIKRKGYDTFAVDSYIDQKLQELDFSKAKLNVYRKQVEFLSEQLEVKQDQNVQLLNSIKSINDNLDVHSIYLHEQDEIIQSAQETADKIIMESLMIAKDVLNTLNETSLNTKDYKDEILNVLNKVRQSIEDIDIIDPINLDLNI